MKSVKKRLATSLRESNSNLSIEHIRLLHVVHEFNEPVQQELSDHLITDKSQLMRQLKLLEEQAYLTRISDTTDRRKKRVILTTRGLELVKNTGKIRDAVIEEFLAGVSAERRSIFYSVLQDMYRNAYSNDKK